jgi:hypothetical protein
LNVWGVGKKNYFLGQIYKLARPNLQFNPARETDANACILYSCATPLLTSHNHMRQHGLTDRRFFVQRSIKSVRRSPVTLQTNRYLKEPKTKSRSLHTQYYLHDICIQIKSKYLFLQLYSYNKIR